MAACGLFLFLQASTVALSQGPTQDVTIKLPGAKLPPVGFSHSSHVDGQKLQCALCHHLDPAQPKACTTCHKPEAEGKTPSAKESFHQQCVTCHKEQAGKAKKPDKIPTKCNGCHKR
ncbi:MAG TPA: cytochrome C3 subunit A [Deltaproteobacteria bacterium]|nr:cytochrome C3 subunit A [Deltaproteobacteria bacterium]